MAPRHSASASAPLHASVASTGTVGVPNRPTATVRLHAGDRQDDVRFDPGQTEQAEQAEPPGDGPQREPNGVRRSAGRVRRHGGSPGSTRAARRTIGPARRSLSRLLSRVEQEKMSMLTVPVSGQVCRTACDSAGSARRSARSPETDVTGRLHDRRAGAPSAAANTAIISSGERLANPVHPLRSTE